MPRMRGRADFSGFGTYVDAPVNSTESLCRAASASIAAQFADQTPRAKSRMTAIGKFALANLRRSSREMLGIQKYLFNIAR